MKVDHRGQLADWNGTRIVQSQAEAAAVGILAIENLLTEAECDTLCRAYHQLSDRVFKSTNIDAYWNDRLLWHADVKLARPDAAAIMVKALLRATPQVRKFFGETAPLFTDLLQIVKWTPGMSMPAHVDNAFDGVGHRQLSAVVYLNDDYAGGETYFTHLDAAVKPTRGMLLAFSAGPLHEHGVLRVHSGIRLTMPLFFTTDRARAEPTHLAYANAVTQLLQDAIEAPWANLASR